MTLELRAVGATTTRGASAARRGRGGAIGSRRWGRVTSRGGAAGWRSRGWGSPRGRRGRSRRRPGSPASSPGRSTRSRTGSRHGVHRGRAREQGGDGRAARRLRRAPAARAAARGASRADVDRLDPSRLSLLAPPGSVTLHGRGACEGREARRHGRADRPAAWSARGSAAARWGRSTSPRRPVAAGWRWRGWMRGRPVVPSAAGSGGARGARCPGRSRSPPATWACWGATWRRSSAGRFRTWRARDAPRSRSPGPRGLRGSLLTSTPAGSPSGTRSPRGRTCASRWRGRSPRSRATVQARLAARVGTLAPSGRGEARGARRGRRRPFLRGERPLARPRPGPRRRCAAGSGRSGAPSTLRELVVAWPGTRFALARPAAFDLVDPAVDRLALAAGEQRLEAAGGVRRGRDHRGPAAARRYRSGAPPARPAADRGRAGGDADPRRAGERDGAPRRASTPPSGSRAPRPGEVGGLQLLGDVAWDGEAGAARGGPRARPRAGRGSRPVARPPGRPLRARKPYEELRVEVHGKAVPLDELVWLAGSYALVSGDVDLTATSRAASARPTLRAGDRRSRNGTWDDLEELAPTPRSTRRRAGCASGRAARSPGRRPPPARRSCRWTWRRLFARPRGRGRGRAARTGNARAAAAGPLAEAARRQAGAPRRPRRPRERRGEPRREPRRAAGDGAAHPRRRRRLGRARRSAGGSRSRSRPGGAAARWSCELAGEAGGAGSTARIELPPERLARPAGARGGAGPPGRGLAAERPRGLGRRASSSLGGAVEGRGALRGTLAAPQAELALSADGAVVEGRPLGAVELDARYAAAAHHRRPGAAAAGRRDAPRRRRARPPARARGRRRADPLGAVGGRSWWRRRSTSGSCRRWRRGSCARRPAPRASSWRRWAARRAASARHHPGREGAARGRGDGRVDRRHHRGRAGRRGAPSPCAASR